MQAKSIGFPSISTKGLDLNFSTGVVVLSSVGNCSESGLKLFTTVSTAVSRGVAPEDSEVFIKFEGGNGLVLYKDLVSLLNALKRSVVGAEDNGEVFQGLEVSLRLSLSLFDDELRSFNFKIPLSLDCTFSFLSHFFSLNISAVLFKLCALKFAAILDLQLTTGLGFS